MRLLISYNPYLLETSFQIDGVPVTARWANELRKRRLQTWFYPAPNWKGMATELEDSLNENEIEIEFEGRALDYSDLCLYFNDWNQRRDKRTYFHILPQKAFLSEEKDILQTLDNLVSTFRDSPVEAMRDSKLLENYHEARGQYFDIAVVATMSSGKSTLINALLGQDLLPAANRATTAKISRIQDTDDTNGFIVECRNRNEILIRECKPATSALLKDYNKDEDVFYVDIKGDIPGISSTALRLKIIDTPGPDNSATDEHRKVTNSILHDTEKQPIILYVLDSTKPEAESDAALLNDIAAEIKRGGRQASERFIFVMNKADEVDENDDGTIDEAIQRGQEYLRSRGIDATQIIPVSARTAKLLRMKHNNQELRSKDESILKFGLDTKLDEAARLTPSCTQKLKQMKHQAEEDGDQYTLDLISSGIVGLELTISEYLEKYAYPYKISQIIKTFHDRLNNELQHANYADRISKDKQAFDEAVKELSKVQEKKGELTERRHELEKQVSGVKFDSGLLDEQQLNFETELAQALDSLRSRWNIDSSDASLPIEGKGAFLHEVELAQQNVVRNMRTTMWNALRAKIEEDFAPIYEEYYSFFREISDTRISDVNFGALEDMCKMETVLESMSKANLDTMANSKSVVFEKTHEEFYQVKNKERDGFWGFFKVWKRWKVDVPRTVSDGKYINVSILYGTIHKETEERLSMLFSEIESNICKLYEQKEHECYDFLDALDDSIQKELDRIAVLTKAVEEKQLDINKNSQCKAWMEEIIRNIDDLIRF